MKRKYSRKYMCEAIDYWRSALLAESLTPETEKKLKAAAKKFASWFGKIIKSGQAQRVEDGNYDALMAVKQTIKINTSKQMPEYARKAFLIAAFGEDNVDVASDMANELARAERSASNLKKSTDQFNFFANEVFMIWRKDPEIAATMGRNPDMAAPAMAQQAAEQAAADAEMDEQEPDVDSEKQSDEEKNDGKEEESYPQSSNDTDNDDEMMNESIRMTRRMARWM